MLTPQQLERIFAEIPNVGDVEELTMECNPGTVTLEKLQAYKSLGVNRLSFGVQSFVEEELKFLTRIHSADEARDAMRVAREAGFDNVNMDLMFALPPQTLESLKYSVEQMINLKPNHISAYSLIFEPGTPLHAQLLKGAVKPHAEDLDAQMYAYVIARLNDAGYEQYEVSNFSQPGMQCKHNLVYWHGEEYASVGPSAHGLIGNERYWNLRSLTAWTQAVEQGELPSANFERIGESERLSELAFLTLRADGMPLKQFADEFGIDLRTALQPDLGYWMEEGMMRDDGTHLRLTSVGYAVCDEITIKVLSHISPKVQHA